jgi:hypothetical protein
VDEAEEEAAAEAGAATIDVALEEVGTTLASPSHRRQAFARHLTATSSTTDIKLLRTK